MKICISASGDNLEARLDPHFGRAMYFLIVDEKGKLLKAIKNTGVQAMHGAGVTAAQIVADEKVDIVVTGNVGPNAFTALTASGIRIFLGGPGMTAKESFEAYQGGGLQEAKVATGPSHAGLGPGRFGRGMGPFSSAGFRGAGRGRGRGGRF